MDFDDIMNMDWISNEEINTNESCYYMEQPFLLEQPLPPIQQDTTAMPTLEQLKHLIEAAKLQVEMKEQELQTAVPSVIFAPPPPAEELNDMLSVQGSEDYKNEPVVKAESVHSEETVTTLEAYAAADGIDLKKLK
ncbi:hypothetical protein G6F56_011716 [Rhizopus delemar]|nr:hypothetical protein G6F56_011716 [Rhizopus delemar]